MSAFLQAAKALKNKNNIDSSIETPKNSASKLYMPFNLDEIF